MRRPEGVREDHRRWAGLEVFIGLEQPAQLGPQGERLTESRPGEHRAKALGLGADLSGDRSRVVEA